ncbi:MAG: DUF5655 domain-containing protein [Chitinophagales bacterium]|nr:DUF5655 domain-containing protein [Chitinophagales bacterium]
MAKTPAEMEAAVLKNLPEKTGKSLEQWLELLQQTGIKDKKALRNWLKESQGLGHVQAGILSGYFLNGGKTSYGNAEELLENQYLNDQAVLRPIYDALVKEIAKLDKSIRLEPCKTYVSVLAKHQIAIVKPDKGFIRLGLVMNPEIPENDILKFAKSFGSDKISHQIKLNDKADIPYAMAFVKEAYTATRSLR